MDALQDEVDALEAILMDDVCVTRNPQSGTPEIIETTIFPALEEESEQQCICVTLQVLPPPGYPDVSPDFRLLRPRGLDDTRLETIRAACIAKIQDLLGAPIVFDLIEVVREHLTGSHLPSGQCVICLYGFSEGDEYTRTECFHYLHSYCLGRHLTALRRNYHEEHNKLPTWLQKTAKPFQATCPVCRENIKDEEDTLKCAMPPAELQNAPDFKLTRELRELQQRMSSLFLQQKSRGGIIDIEAVASNVISIETEEDVRRRLRHKKQEDSTKEEDSNSFQSVAQVEGGEDAIVGTGSAAVTGSGSNCTTTNKDSASSSSLASSASAKSNDDTHQPNRRHHRGGRRHQNHHHHHHRDRDRERERFEHNHIGGSHSSTSASAASTTGTGPTGGKHPKAQHANNALSR